MRPEYRGLVVGLLVSGLVFAQFYVLPSTIQHLVIAVGAWCLLIAEIVVLALVAFAVFLWMTGQSVTRKVTTVRSSTKIRPGSVCRLGTPTVRPNILAMHMLQRLAAAAAARRRASALTSAPGVAHVSASPLAAGVTTVSPSTAVPSPSTSTVVQVAHQPPACVSDSKSETVTATLPPASVPSPAPSRIIPPVSSASPSANRKRSRSSVATQSSSRAIASCDCGQVSCARPQVCCPGLCVVPQTKTSTSSKRATSSGRKTSAGGAAGASIASVVVSVNGKENKEDISKTTAPSDVVFPTLVPLRGWLAPSNPAGNIQKEDASDMKKQSRDDDDEPPGLTEAKKEDDDDEDDGEEEEGPGAAPVPSTGAGTSQTSGQSQCPPGGAVSTVSDSFDA